MLDGERVLSAITCEEVERLVQCHVVSGGMVLKLEAAKRAIEGGVRDVHIVGGTAPDALLRVSHAGELSDNDFRPIIPGTRVLREPLLDGRKRLFRRRDAQMTKKTRVTVRSASAKLRAGGLRQAQFDAAALSDADTVSFADLQAPPIVFTHGRGATSLIRPAKNISIFSAASPSTRLGHAHPRIVKTDSPRIARAIHFSNLFHNEFQGPLARKLARMVRHGPRFLRQ